MSTVVDVSSVLGEYMLKGWILSDNICTKCSKVPLMRSKSSPPTEFCANCDGGPVSTSSQKVASTLSQHSSTASSVSPSASRPSTPPTEVSSALSSPTFAPPVDMEEINRRRQQSDLASAEIGKLLLKGWAMLADECPNNTCYGVPLVRPPRNNGEQSPRKECVVCHTVYVDRPGGGLERLASSQVLEQPSAVSARGISNRTQEVTATPLTLSAPPISRTVTSDRSPNASTIRILPDTSVPSNTTSNSTVRTLQTTADALEQSLRGLTGRLDFVSNGQAFDANLIGQTADAITKVTQALIKVKELQWSERQASEL